MMKKISGLALGLHPINTKTRPRQLSPFNPIRPSLFSCSPGPRGGSEAQIPKTKVNINRFEMKLCMSHYIHKSIPDAKFDPDSSSKFWRYDVRNFPSKEGNESSNSAIYPQKTGLTLKK